MAKAETGVAGPVVAELAFEPLEGDARRGPALVPGAPQRSGETLGKPTHFEVRDGKF